MKNNKSGFTLIELLVVVLIVGILSAVALPQYSTAVEKARSAEALALMNAVAESAERYCFQKDAWPNDFSQLDIEVPAASDSGYGGKNFSLSIDGGNSDCTTSASTYQIKAERRDVGYILKTELQYDPSTETINATRSCVHNNNEKKKKYCDAITNGHNDAF